MSEQLIAWPRALRVELGVLLRWPVAWCLCLAFPVTMVVGQLAFVIAFQFNGPNLAAGPAGNNTWALALSSVVPTVFQFAVYESVLAMAVGAVVVAADWERGTVKTGRLAGSGRVPVALARAVGVWLILALSAVLTFAAAVAVCALSGVFWPSWFLAGQRSMPPIGVLAHGIEVFAFTNLAYGGLGLAAGALTRRVAPAVILCVIFALGVEPLLYDVGAGENGVFAFLFQHTPDAATITLSATFGEPGGGGIQPPASGTVAHTTLWVCCLGFAAVQVLLEFRDGGGRRFSHRFPRVRRVLSRWPSVSTLAFPRRAAGLGSGSTLAAVRAELSAIRRWPGVIALAAVLPVWTLITKYAVPYVLHKEHVSFATPSQYVPWLLPHHVLDVTMNYLNPGNDPLGVAALGLLGAWLAASSWGEGSMLSLALTQGQGRTQVVVGQVLAAIVVAASSALATLGLAVIGSELLRLTLSGNGALPSIAHLAAGAGETVLIASSYVTVGWAVGFLVKSVGVAMVIVLGWVLALQPWVIEYVGPLTHGTLHWIYNVLPETLALSLAYAQGTDHSFFGPGGAPAPTGGPPGVTTAIWLLGSYVLIAVAVVTVVAARRDVRGGPV